MALGTCVLLVGGVYAYVKWKSAENEPEGGFVNMPNPMVECKSSEDFAKYGLTLKTPANATDVSYYMIAGQIAEIKCVIGGKEYCFRAAKDSDYQSLSGVYGDWIRSDRSSKAEYYQIKGDPEYHVAGWTAEGITYCASTTASEEDLAKAVEEYIK